MTRDNFNELRLRGATSFLFLKPTECQRLLSEASAYNLKLAKKEVGDRKVRQNFFEATIEDRSTNIMNTVSSIQKYIYEKVIYYGGSEAFVSPLEFKEVRIHKYPVGGFLEYHRDDKDFKNLIVNVLLKGESCFYLSKDNLGTEERLIESHIGWCTVVVAPGFFGEKRQPPHCVKGVTVERWSLGMRDITLIPVHR